MRHHLLVSVRGAAPKVLDSVLCVLPPHLLEHGVRVKGIKPQRPLIVGDAHPQLQSTAASLLCSPHSVGDDLDPRTAMVNRSAGILWEPENVLDAFLVEHQTKEDPGIRPRRRIGGGGCGTAVLPDPNVEHVPYFAVTRAGKGVLVLHHLAAVTTP